MQANLGEFAAHLEVRARRHDLSKLVEPEKSAFDACLPALKGAAYGTAAYMTQLERLGVALRHHYAVNSHHPEHFVNGVRGMSLLDVVEMLADWKASAERDGNDAMTSLEVSVRRHRIEAPIAEVLRNTLRELNW